MDMRLRLVEHVAGNVVTCISIAVLRFVDGFFQSPDVEVLAGGVRSPIVTEGAKKFCKL